MRSHRGKSYKLENMYDFAGLIQRNNKAGKYSMDEHGLLNQVKKQTDLFLDEATGEVILKDMPSKKYDTSLFDAGINEDEKYGY